MKTLNLEKIGNTWYFLNSELELVISANDEVLFHLEQFGGFEIHGEGGLGKVSSEDYILYLEEEEGEIPALIFTSLLEKGIL